jgi:hypothetical protein
MGGAFFLASGYWLLATGQTDLFDIQKRLGIRYHQPVTSGQVPEARDQEMYAPHR